MTQGTKSYLFGCHQFLLHPLLVAIAWKKHHGKTPNWKEAICILIHDIGIIGRQYLEPGQKDGHWEQGAQLANKWFGLDGFKLCAGHSDGYGSGWYSWISLEGAKKLRSKMFIPDKISYLYAPLWWLKWCQWFEGFNELCTAQQWRDMVRKNMEAGFPMGSHRMYEDLKYARGEIAKTLYRLHHETDEMWEGEKDYWYEDADAIMQLEVTTMCIDYDYGRYPYERTVTKTLAELEGSK